MAALGLSCPVLPLMFRTLMSGIVDLGGGGGREKSISEHAVNVSGRCMVARQETSALLGCRKKVFENARQMWFLSRI